MTELPDRLLRDALDQAASTAPSTTCVDGERLAAWAEGGVTGAERAVIEAHAAGCARCLALLAAMARTEPAPIALPWWRRSSIAWLLPLAAVTAGLVIVVRLAVLEQRSAASLPPAAPAAAALPRVDMPQAVPAPGPAPVSSAASQAPVPTRRQPSAPVAGEAGRAARAVPERSVSDAGAPKPAAAAPAAAAPPLAAPSPASASAVGVQLGGGGGRGGARTFAADNAMKTAQGGPPVPVVIASPDRESQWRIVGGIVEHTTDGGATWQPQTIGVVTTLRVGAAPDARVCWLAGASGLVLRTIDGGTWTRIPFPESVDLVAIRAGDAAHAAVTTADGQHFTTSDGGTTWVRQ